MALVPVAETREDRRQWLERRRRIEAALAREKLRQSIKGTVPQPGLAGLEGYIGAALKLSGMMKAGMRNALDVRLTRLEMDFPDLPSAFDGYTILFVSDIHAGLLPQILERGCALAGQVGEVDLMVLGGDYQSVGEPDAAEVGRFLAPLVGAVRTRDGAVAVLGNHDRHEMAAVLEGLGVTVLLNRWAEIDRDGQSIAILGLDDVHAFHTPAAGHALTRPGEGFRIAVVHSVDMASEAAAAGFSLYLSGHTHHGQIALPGGIPLFTALDSHRHLAVGPWRVHGMRGYTSSGLGVGRPPVRFNTRGEISVIRLRSR